jgi:predicted GNAT family acetyltransferase
MASRDTTHPLDNPIWHALSSVHACFAEGDGCAKRYPTEVAPLAAVREQSQQAYNSLGELLGEQDVAVMFLDAPPRAPQGWRLVHGLQMEQMVCTVPPEPVQHSYEIKELNSEDVPQMLSLTALTEPGPFRKRTIEFGGYRGIRDSELLVAMTGQRLSLTGFTEVSAVCTHPEYRGRGYAIALVSAVAQTIFARGETPFLGVRQDNTPAIKLYEKLGFKIRRSLHLAVVQRPS